jgi:RNA:NAD 2'-phosphotransferase (TPT1/KptA family)
MDTNKRELQRFLSAAIRGFPLKVTLSKRHSGLMPYNKALKGKREVIPWLKAAGADQKEPIITSTRRGR